MVDINLFQASLCKDLSAGLQYSQCYGASLCVGNPTNCNELWLTRIFFARVCLGNQDLIKVKRFAGKTLTLLPPTRKHISNMHGFYRQVLVFYKTIKLHQATQVGGDDIFSAGGKGIGEFLIGHAG